MAITEPAVQVLQVSDGSVVYNGADGLLLPRFNADATKLAGITPDLAAVSIQLADGVEDGPYGRRRCSLHHAGDVLARGGGGHDRRVRFLVRDETDGTEVSLAGLDGIVGSPTLSPTGQYVGSVDSTSDGNLVRVYRVSDRTLVSMHADPLPLFTARDPVRARRDGDP